MTEELQMVTMRVIKKIWTETLNVPEIPGDRSFFELGGDSLLMIDMIVRVSEEMKTEIDPSLLFESATLEGFSALVAAEKQKWQVCHAEEAI